MSDADWFILSVSGTFAGLHAQTDLIDSAAMPATGSDIHCTAIIVEAQPDNLFPLDGTVECR